jgi:hypothetical protein
MIPAIPPVRSAPCAPAGAAYAVGGAEGRAPWMTPARVGASLRSAAESSATSA